MAVGAGSRAGTGTDGHALVLSVSLCRSEAIAGVSIRAWRGRSALPVLCTCAIPVSLHFVGPSESPHGRQQMVSSCTRMEHLTTYTPILPTMTCIVMMSMSLPQYTTLHLNSVFSPITHLGCLLNKH